ncbi:hypothetical protein [Uliginosibacterium sp. 31-12]|uniref:hypothetical protein n=1 Tax=Uliginosibacterium sp. 31-12 TaxID=3062781 RepID=UPI0026E1D9BE|nr:hypothetical protein [Uliginosibacterium sp. 31-12]MDO6387047.1 hypothetical protein [Uliginosibacterium sp. 31-12]
MKHLFLSFRLAATLLSPVVAMICASQISQAILPSVYSGPSPATSAGMANIGLAIVVLGVPVIYAIGYGVLLPLLLPRVATSKIYSPTFAVGLLLILGFFTYQSLGLFSSSFESEGGSGFLLVVVAMLIIGALDYLLAFHNNVALREWHGPFKKWLLQCLVR